MPISMTRCMQHELRRVSKVPATALTPQRLLLRYHFLLFFYLISRGSGSGLRASWASSDTSRTRVAGHAGLVALPLRR